LQIAWYEIDEAVDHLFYALEAVISAVLLTNILQFGWWRAKARRGKLTHWQRFEAVYYLLAAVPLNLMYNLAVVFIYIGKINYPDSKMWYGETWFPNVGHGIFLFILKWIGMGLLTVGVLKVTQLHRKIIQKWRDMRGTGQTKVTEVP